VKKAPLLLVAGLLALPVGLAAQTFLINRVVLRVNDRIATLMDYQRQLSERRQALQAAQEVDEERRSELLASAGRTVMAEMYEELLLLSRADQLGARSSDVEVDEAVASMRQRMGLESEEEFRASLAAAGLTLEALRSRLRDNLLVQEVVGREVQNRIEIEEEELRRIWRENPEAFAIAAAVRLQDVVVLSEGRDMAEVRDTAAKVRAELAAGGDIGEVATRWAAEGKTTQMVDLGWVERSDLDPALEAAAWGLPLGGVSEPVQGRGGLHVLRLIERREASVRPFEEVKGAIEARQRQMRMASEYGKYLRELEESAHIVMQLPPEAEGFRGLDDAGPALQVPAEIDPVSAPLEPTVDPADEDAAAPGPEPALPPIEEPGGGSAGR
jgi:peptidyl-prolyl cis-trans isomerase SurA